MVLCKIENRHKKTRLTVANIIASRCELTLCVFSNSVNDNRTVSSYIFLCIAEDYIHRIGRTGRAGKKGVSHTFFHQGDKARAGELVNVLQVCDIFFVLFFAMGTRVVAYAFVL